MADRVAGLLPPGLKVLAFGDSTTARRPGLGRVYGEFLHEALRVFAPGAEIEIDGEGGATAGASQERLTRALGSFRPHVTVIQFGINDSTPALWRSPPETEPPVSAQDFARQLQALTRTAATAGSRVLLATPNPLRWSRTVLRLYGRAPFRPDDPDGANPCLREHAAALRSVARSEGATLVDVLAHYDAEDYCDRWLVDGIHPNEDGQRQVALLVLEALVRLFRHDA